MAALRGGAVSYERGTSAPRGGGASDAACSTETTASTFYLYCDWPVAVVNTSIYCNYESNIPVSRTAFDAESLQSRRPVISNRRCLENAKIHGRAWYKRLDAPVLTLDVTV